MAAHKQLSSLMNAILSFMYNAKIVPNNSDHVFVNE